LLFGKFQKRVSNTFRVFFVNQEARGIALWANALKRFRGGCLLSFPKEVLRPRSGKDKEPTAWGGSFRIERWRSSPNLPESLLESIVRVAGISEYAMQQPKNDARVSREELLKRRFISDSNSLDQLLVCHSSDSPRDDRSTPSRRGRNVGSSAFHCVSSCSNRLNGNTGFPQADNTY